MRSGADATSPPQRQNSEMKRDTAVVNKRAVAPWRHGHPWIYSSDVLKRPDEEPGAVRVLCEDGGVLGTALWSPRSTISLRMLSSGEVAIDASFWLGRLTAAAEYRRTMAPDSNAYRLVHAEAD